MATLLLSAVLGDAMLFRRLLLAVTMAYAPPGWAKTDPAPPVPQGSRIEAQFTAKVRSLGHAVNLALLVDERITTLLRHAMEEYYLFGFTADERIAPMLDPTPLAEATIVLFDDNGKVRETTNLNTPFAQLHQVGASAPNLFMLETSEGGFGQFTGTSGKVLSIDQGIIRHVTAIDDETKTAEDIALQRSPGSDWRILAVPSHVGTIFQVICRPGDANDAGFGESYITYRIDKGTWHRNRIVTNGYCNWENGFPPLSSFP